MIKTDVLFKIDHMKKRRKLNLTGCLSKPETLAANYLQ